jgi:hypothetical protein
MISRNGRWPRVMRCNTFLCRSLNRRRTNNYGREAPGLIREIFSNPFAPPRFDPAGRSSDVLALVRGIYDRRTYKTLPVLADAIREAGCDNDELLNHFRDTSRTHIRGCWALDLCLGLE